MQAGVAKGAVVWRAGVRAAVDEREKRDRPRAEASILPPACQGAREIAAVSHQGLWHTIVSSISPKRLVHSMSGQTSSNMVSRSFSRGELMVAAAAREIRDGELVL